LTWRQACWRARRYEQKCRTMRNEVETAETRVVVIYPHTHDALCNGTPMSCHATSLGLTATRQIRLHAGTLTLWCWHSCRTRDTTLNGPPSEIHGA
jgi:hypothetical protein